MKRIYSVLLFSAAVFSLHAQQADRQDQVARALKPVSDYEVNRSRALGQDQPVPQRGTDFFCEDFSNGFDGNNPFGAWTFEDTGGNTIWMMADANSPGGDFSGNAGTLDSPTADNGWVIFDCDLYNSPFDPNTYEDVTGFLYSPEINMSELNSVIVDYYQYFRYCCFPGSPLTLEVSTDGGINWVVFPAHGSFIEAANEQSATPLYTRVDVSCVAANQPAVQLRWGYNSAGETGYSHYFWGLDDICIYENPSHDDLEVMQLTNGDVFNWWEYRVTPYDQRNLEADGGLYVGTMFRNIGDQDQTNVTVTVEIMDASMNVLSTTVSEPFDMVAYGNSETCPPQLSDTLYMYTDWEAPAVGDYYVRTTIVSDQIDETSDNNTMEKMIVISEDEYGHDDETNLNVELRPRENDDTTPNAPTYDPTGYGSWFHCPNDAVTTAYGLKATLGGQSDQGCEFIAVLFEGGTDNIYDPNGAEVVTISSWAYDDAWDDTEVYFPFEESVELFAGQTYFVAIMEEFGSDEEITVLANGNSDTDNSTLIYERAGSGAFVWFTSQTPTPAVRMITSERVGLDEIADMNGITLHQNVPNPTNGNTMISYELEQSMKVRFEVVDIQGRVVESMDLGNKPAGEHKIEFSSNDLANGMYTYTLIANDVRISKRMMVSGN